MQAGSYAKPRFEWPQIDEFSRLPGEPSQTCQWLSMEEWLKEEGFEPPQRRQKSKNKTSTKMELPSFEGPGILTGGEWQEADCDKELSTTKTIDTQDIGKHDWNSDDKQTLRLVATEAVGKMGWLPDVLAPPQPTLVAHADPDGWAYRSGLRVGDELVNIDEEAVALMSKDVLLRRLKLRPTTLTFQRLHVPQKLQTSNVSVASVVSRHCGLGPDIDFPWSGHRSDNHDGIHYEGQCNGDMLEIIATDEVGKMGWIPDALEPPRPVLVSHVDARGWAFWRGIKPGDELLRINGQSVAALETEELHRMLRHRPARMSFRRPRHADLEPALLESEFTASTPDPKVFHHHEVHFAFLAESAAWNSMDMSRFKSDVSDIFEIARHRLYRRRAVLAISSFLQRAVKASWGNLRDLACWYLCLMAWSPSFHDIELYETPDVLAHGPVVLLCGQTGAHLDSLRPIAARWASNYKATVIVFVPCIHGYNEQLVTVSSQLRQLLLDGRPLVVHAFGNVAFGAIRTLLQSWFKRGASARAPDLTSLACIVVDSAGLGHDSSFDFALDVGFSYTCGLNLLKTYGICEGRDEEPAKALAKALHHSTQSGMITKEFRMFELPPTFEDIVEALLPIPMLLLASDADSIVPLVDVELLVDRMRSLPNRKAVIKKRWGSKGAKVVGQDGLAVHTWFCKASQHLKHVDMHRDAYWLAVDRLVSRCV